LFAYPPAALRLTPPGLAAHSGAVMLDHVQPVVVLSVITSIAFFSVGAAMQDYEGDEPIHLSGSDTDGTWGTYGTDFAIAVQLLAFGVVAPFQGPAKAGMRASCGALCVAWLCSGLLHLVFHDSSVLHTSLDVVSLVGLVLGNIGLLYTAHAVVQDLPASKSCGCWTLKTITWAYGAFGLVGVAGVLAGLFVGKLEGEPWMVLQLKQTLAFAPWWFTTYGFMGSAPMSTTSLLVATILAGSLSVVKPAPFRSSGDFNDNALVHASMMLFYAALYSMLHEMADQPVRQSRWLQWMTMQQEQEQESMFSLEAAKPANAPKGTGCCPSGCVRSSWWTR